MKNRQLLLAIFFSFLTTYTAIAQTELSKANAPVMLNHIALHVKNLSESGDFYSKIIGLKQIPEPFHDGIHIWYTLGAAGQLHLIQKDEPLIVAGKTSHICFSVKSIEAFIKNLDKNNVDYTNWPGTAKEPTIRTDGVKQIYFQDPNGYWIEVNNDYSID